MATYEQLPGTLNIVTTTQDDLSILLDFDISLTGYTFVSYVQYGSSQTAITVTNTNLAAGQITLSLTDAQLTAIGNGTYGWYLKWNNGTADRKILAGEFTIRVKDV